MKIKFFLLLFLFSFTFSQGVALALSVPGDFSDVPPSHPNYTAIMYFKGLGIVEGFSDGTYKPNQLVNRVGALKIILLGSNIPVATVSGTGGFIDTDPLAWYAKYIIIGVQRGIVKGYADLSFKPTKTLNLAEGLKIILKAQNIDVSKVVPPKNSYATAWFARYFEYAKQKNLIGIGYPDQGMTRGRLAEIMYRLAFIQKNKLDAYPKNSISSPESGSSLLPTPPTKTPLPMFSGGGSGSGGSSGSGSSGGSSGSGSGGSGGSSGSDSSGSGNTPPSTTGVSTNIPAGAVFGLWKASGSPYLVFGDIYIPSGKRLTIEPGVQVRFQGHYRLEGPGVIDARGTSSSQRDILFTAEDKTVGWYGIRLWNGTGAFGVPPDVSDYHLENCIIEYVVKDGSNSRAFGDSIYNDSRGALYVYGVSSWGADCPENYCGLKYSDLHLNGLMLRHNKAISNSSPASEGGGIYFNTLTGGVQPVWSDVVFDDNQAVAYGGAIAMHHSGSITFKNGSMTNNKALNPEQAGAGGAIGYWDVIGPITLDHVVYSGNDPAGFATANSPSVIVIDGPLPPPPPTAPELSLKVTGNHLVDIDGNTIRLLGVNRSGSEFKCIQTGNPGSLGWGIFDGPIDLASAQAIASWHANAVRIPLNEDCWLGINGVKSQWSGLAYQNAIRDYVSTLHQAGLYVILDLHWNAPGNIPAATQQPLPDADHAVDFWTSVATAFKDDLGVVFDLYNEPFLYSNYTQDPNQDVWDCWLNGCTLNQYLTGGDPYNQAYVWDTVGMQTLLDTVRATGATNVVMAGGLEWSNDLTQWLSYKPIDPLNNLAAGWHAYSSQTCSNETCWNSVIAPVAAQVPIITGETGDHVCAAADYMPVFSAWANAHGVSFFGWTWNTWPGCEFVLIQNYDGTPTTNYGQAFHDLLLSVNP